MKYIARLALIVSLSFMLGGCAMKWQPDWQADSRDSPTTQSAVLFDTAQKLFNRAEDESSLRVSIKAFEDVLKENPGDYQTLKQLSTQYILLGTAYTDSRKEKSHHFRRAMTYAEQAMYTNPNFRQLVDVGAKPWEATEALGAQEAEAMFFWVTALQYEFKEGMSLPGKIINIDWLQRALVFLDRIEKVAPEFGGGAVEFAKVICYYALPQSKGGSKIEGDAYMQKAILKGENRLFPRWARGKYYYPILGETEKGRQDLAWVASQDAGRFEDSYPWRVHFQDDAREILR